MRTLITHRVELGKPKRLAYPDVLDDEVDGNRVLSPTWHDDVSKFLGGNAEFFKRWLYCRN